MIKKQILFITLLCLVFNAITMEVMEEDEAGKKELNIQLAHAIFNNNISLVKDLIARRADVNWSSSDGLTPLIRAAFNEYTAETTEILIQAGANLEKETCYHQTALMKATIRKNSKIAQILINARANVNCTDSNGLTPLMRTACYGYEEIATMLLHAKADMYQINEYGGTALSAASSNYQPDIVQMLLHEITILSPLEKNSIKNWFLVNRRLSSEGLGLPKDLKNLIAQTIWQLLIEDVHKRLVQAGALKALTFLEKRPDVHELDPQNARWEETLKLLNHALTMKELKSNILRQIVREESENKQSLIL
jgi:ankyrin repeat protein